MKNINIVYNTLTNDDINDQIFAVLKSVLIDENLTLVDSTLTMSPRETCFTFTVDEELNEDLQEYIKDEIESSYDELQVSFA